MAKRINGLFFTTLLCLYNYFQFLPEGSVYNNYFNPIISGCILFLLLSKLLGGQVFYVTRLMLLYTVLCLYLLFAYFLRLPINAWYGLHFADFLMLGAILLPLTQYKAKNDGSYINNVLITITCISLFVHVFKCLVEIYFFMHPWQLHLRYIIGFFYNSATLSNYIVSILPFIFCAALSFWYRNSKEQVWTVI